MSRRGRGGRGGLSKAVREHLNLPTNEILKEPTIGAPETFPPLQYVPQKSTEELSQGKTYMLMVKKELREHFQNSEYFITLTSKKPDIERYSDRFHCLNSNPQLHLDWSRFPKELCTLPASSSKRKKSTKGSAKVNVKHARTVQVKDVDIKVKLEELEKRETTGEDTEKKEEDDKEENVVDEEEEEDDFDEEMDEGTDYINSYFDNGENYIDDDGDAHEEGIC